MPLDQLDRGLYFALKNFKGFGNLLILHLIKVALIPNKIPSLEMISSRSGSFANQIAKLLINCKHEI
ncbi:hypothetical protein CA596_00860 [Paenibacillus odorifer]|nr:hypothetical protein CA596_00860 [Paenibacillus odorifer]